jgi:hypothetical protein
MECQEAAGTRNEGYLQHQRNRVQVEFECEEISAEERDKLLAILAPCSCCG